LSTTRGQKNDIVYIDTPGLADIELRKKAAQEITLALKSCGYFRIFFVITLEEGRIRPDDMTTMKLVLDAAPIGCNYSIIVNKLHPKAKEKLLEGDNRKKLEACLNHNLPGTSSIYYNENVEGLISQDNVLHQLPTALAQFIASSPVIEILPDEVKDVKDEDYGEVIKLLTGQLEILTRSIEEINKELIENQKKIEENRKEYERQIEKLTEENKVKLDNLIKKHQKVLKKISEDDVHKKVALSNPPPPITTPTPTPHQHQQEPPSTQTRGKGGCFGSTLGTIGGVFSNILLPGSGPFVERTISSWFD